MKKPQVPIFRLLIDYLSGNFARRRSEVKAADQLDWQLLLSSFNARISIAYKSHTNNTQRVFFRHGFPGFARIELHVGQRKTDGTLKLQTILHGSGYAFEALSDPRNVLLGGDGSVISIISMSVRYIAHGVSYHLNIDAENGSQQLKKEGRIYQHGPQFTLALRSFTLSSCSPAPILTNHRPGIIPLTLAAC